MHIESFVSLILDINHCCVSNCLWMQFMMELMANGSVGAPKSYSLNMSADIVPMCVLLETSQGKVYISF